MFDYPLIDFKRASPREGGTAEGEAQLARGFISTMNRIARENERSRRAQIRARRQSDRDDEKHQRAMEKLERQAYLEERQAETEDLNEEASTAVDELNSILNSALEDDLTIQFAALRQTVDASAIDQDPALALPDRPATEFTPPRRGVLGRLLPGSLKRHERRVEAASQEHSSRLAHYETIQARRAQQLDELTESARQHNAEIAELERLYVSSDPIGVISYFEAVFERSDYPDAFPHAYTIGFVPESQQLIVDVELPTIDDLVPLIEKYRYTKSSDTITEVKRSDKSRRDLYASALAQTVLRTVHEAFSTDASDAALVVAVNAFVSTIDPSTGRAIRPCLISVRVSRDQYDDLNLSLVDPARCLKQLRASVSQAPNELLAVKPIVDINMADPRFISETDVLSGLDARPNLMELTPSEFESLITNLFQAMGLETRLTQASRDGGVDCVAFDNRPVFGGKVVIQAKRYKNTVGVSSVRDLYGTMLNEGASKGILVSTSGYGKAAFDFAAGKPIELISGSNLLSLLSEHADVEAKIIMPDSWSGY